MKGLFELIRTYSSDNAIMPVIAVISLVATLLIYIFLKKKWIKYAVNGLIAFVGAIMMFTGYKSMLEASGLEMIINATKVLTFGLVGLMFSVILDILDSLSKLFKKNKIVKIQNKKIDNKTKKLTNTSKKKFKTKKTNLNDETKLINLKNIEKNQ